MVFNGRHAASKNHNVNFFLGFCLLYSRDNHQKRLPWKQITKELNEALNFSNRKKPYQCCERWKNVLSKKCKKGQWTKTEDLIIISFVNKYGPKWSRLAKMCPERSEHHVKNRFFSLISKHFNIPILKIKQSFNYLDSNILEEVKMGLNTKISF